MKKIIFDIQHFADFNNSSDNQVINGTSGNDSITNSGNNVTIDAAAGDDAVFNYGAAVYVALGDGEDYFSGNGANNTITGGAGSDKIWLSGNTSANTQINYTYGDGNDVIYYFTSDDKIYITTPTNFTTARNDEDMYLTFDNRESISLKYVDSAVGSENFVIISSGDNSNVLQKNESGYTYSGGNKYISDYASEKINYQTDYQGFSFNDTDFILSSSSGNLTVQNVRDKLIDVAIDGNTVAYAFMASSSGVINGGGISQLEIILGGSYTSNEFIAGNGGSSMWGGVCGIDTLTGGDGNDNFFFGKNDGVDLINNASSADLIYLYDINLSDIVSVSYGTNQINLNLSSGSYLQVSGVDNNSATFQLTDGSKFKCDTNTQAWSVSN